MKLLLVSYKKRKLQMTEIWTIYMKGRVGDFGEASNSKLILKA